MTTETVEAVFDGVAETAPDVLSACRADPRRRAGTNPSGERQHAADVEADEVLCRRLAEVPGVGSYASEERENVVAFGDGLAVAADPLDGTANLPTNNPVGTIVGVYDAPVPARGRDLVGAGYVLYGPRTTMVTAVDGTVTEYELLGGSREPLRRDVTLPADPTVYGFGGRVPEWSPGFRAFAREAETELKRRYGGAFVADVNQVLGRGGVFAYPWIESREGGKLRLQFEANPVAYVIEAAGGASTDGSQSILDVEATALHQRVPVHLGNASLVDRVEERLEVPA